MTGVQSAVPALNVVLSTQAGDAELRAIIEGREKVLGRYGPMFLSDGINALTVEEFRSFLMFRNNLHWSGLQRMAPSVTQDMDALRNALHELLDESVPVAERLDSLLPKGKARVSRQVGRPRVFLDTPLTYSRSERRVHHEQDY